MNWLLPSLMRVRMFTGLPALWMPLFLLWPLWLIALGFCFSALFVIGVGFGRLPVATSLKGAFECTYLVHELACALRGTRCDVSAAGHEMSFSIV